MSKNTRTRIILTAVAALLLVTMAVGGTIAWLQDTTDEVTNKFLKSTIDIELTETDRTYKMVPSVDIAKDPYVTVKAGSEASYVFVVVEETGIVTVGSGETAVKYTFDNFLEYAYTNDWTLVASTTKTNDKNDVYVLGKEVPASESDQKITILEGDKVSTKDDVTKAMLDAVTESNQPTLSFQAYAIQQANGNDTDDGLFTMEEAWTQLGVTLPTAVNP